jgi:hypothetical protein
MTIHRRLKYERQRRLACRALARIGAVLVRDPGCGFYRIEQCPIRRGANRGRSDRQLVLEFLEVRQL